MCNSYETHGNIHSGRSSREVRGRASGEAWGNSGKSRELTEALGKSDSLPATHQNCLRGWQENAESSGGGNPHIPCGCMSLSPSHTHTHLGIAYIPLAKGEGGCILKPPGRNFVTPPLLVYPTPGGVFSSGPKGRKDTQTQRFHQESHA